MALKVRRIIQNIEQGAFSPEDSIEIIKAFNRALTPESEIEADNENSIEFTKEQLIQTAIAYGLMPGYYDLAKIGRVIVDARSNGFDELKEETKQVADRFALAMDLFRKLESITKYVQFCAPGSLGRTSGKQKIYPFTPADMGEILSLMSQLKSLHTKLQKTEVHGVEYGTTMQLISDQLILSDRDTIINRDLAIRQLLSEAHNIHNALAKLFEADSSLKQDRAEQNLTKICETFETRKEHLEQWRNAYNPTGRPVENVIDRICIHAETHIKEGKTFAETYDEMIKYYHSRDLSPQEMEELEKLEEWAMGDGDPVKNLATNYDRRRRKGIVV